MSQTRKYNQIDGNIEPDNSSNTYLGGERVIKTQQTITSKY